MSQLFILAASQTKDKNILTVEVLVSCSVT